MKHDMSTAVSPLKNMEYRFERYLNKRKEQQSRHMLGNGIPDYAYKMDYSYRKKLDSIPGVFNTANKLCSTIVAREMQNVNLNGLAVGPNQFPEIYQIGCDCAKRLGIAIPNIFVCQLGDMNAFTYACDDVEPFIVISEFALERLTLGEVKAVIGHECGHIQNYHGTYETLCNYIALSGLIGVSLLDTMLLQLVSNGIDLTLQMWSRAAEVSADRAAMICCDSVDDVYNLFKKFLYGGVKIDDKITTELSIESLQKQLSITSESGARILEINSSHPATIKRILACMEFAECDTFYQWRPDMKKPGQTIRSHEDTDLRCKKFIDVTSKEAGTIVGKRRSQKNADSV